MRGVNKIVVVVRGVQRAIRQALCPHETMDCITTFDAAGNPTLHQTCRRCDHQVVFKRAPLKVQ